MRERKNNRAIMRFTFSVTQRIMAVCLWIENELQSFTETRTLKHIQPFRFTGCFHNYVQSALLNTFTEQHPQSYLPHTQRTKDTVSPTNWRSCCQSRKNKVRTLRFFCDSIKQLYFTARRNNMGAQITRVYVHTFSAFLASLTKSLKSKLSAWSSKQWKQC